MNNIKYIHFVFCQLYPSLSHGFSVLIFIVIHNHMLLSKTYSHSFRVMGFKIIVYHISSTTFIWSLLNFFLTIVVSVMMDSVNITVCEFGEYYILLRTQIFFNMLNAILKFPMGALLC